MRVASCAWANSWLCRARLAGCATEKLSAQSSASAATGCHRLRTTVRARVRIAFVVATLTVAVALEKLVRVQYGTKSKTLPSTVLGRLSAAPSSQVAHSEIEREQQPQIGDGLASNEAALLLMGIAGCKFAPGELVGVPRSSGGFTVGRVEGSMAVPCPSGHPHQVAACRVITCEADDEAPARAKVLVCGLVGKLLTPWAVHQREDLQLARARHGSGAAHSAHLRDDLQESVDEDVESRLRERFGDFKPFLHDEEDNGVALQGQCAPRVMACQSADWSCVRF